MNETEVQAVAGVFARALGDDTAEWLEEAREAVMALDRVRADDARDGSVKLEDVERWMRDSFGRGTAAGELLADAFLAEFSGEASAGGRTDQNDK